MQNAQTEFSRTVEQYFEPFSKQFLLHILLQPQAATKNAYKSQLFDAANSSIPGVKNQIYKALPSPLRNALEAELTNEAILSAPAHIVIISTRGQDQQIVATGRLEFHKDRRFCTDMGIWCAPNFRAKQFHIEIPGKPGQSASLAMVMSRYVCFVNILLTISNYHSENVDKLYMTPEVSPSGSNHISRFNMRPYEAGGVPKRNTDGFHDARTHPAGYYVHHDDIPFWDEVTQAHYTWRSRVT